jgi:hypothetical protein
VLTERLLCPKPGRGSLLGASSSRVGLNLFRACQLLSIIHWTILLPSFSLALMSAQIPQLPSCAVQMRFGSKVAERCAVWNHCSFLRKIQVHWALDASSSFLQCFKSDGRTLYLADAERDFVGTCHYSHDFLRTVCTSSAQGECGKKGGVFMRLPAHKVATARPSARLQTRGRKPPHR